MSYTSYSNAKATINGNTFFAKSVDLSSKTSLSPVYLSEERSSFFSKATDGSRGTFSISYYITGSDPLKPFIVNEKTALTGSLGGIYFNGGYLTSHSINGVPFQPVLVRATIDFFGNLSGEFAPTTEKLPSNKILTFTDVTINKSGIGEDEIQSMRYGFNSEITPLYCAGDSTPSEIRFIKKQSNMEINTCGISGNLPFEGQETQAALNINNDTGVAEKYSVSGPLESRFISAQAGAIMNSQLSISQNFIDEKPSLTSVTTTGNAMALGGEGFELHGSNLLNTTAIQVGDRTVQEITVFGANKVSGTLADDTMPGLQRIYLTTYGGKDSSMDITVGDSGL